MDNNINKIELYNCIERIEKLYMYDTIEFLDCVLTDDRVNPEYSANTVYNRLKEILIFEKLYFKSKIKDIPEWLSLKGYTQDEIDLLNNKMIEEDIRHNKT